MSDARLDRAVRKNAMPPFFFFFGGFLLVLARCNWRIVSFAAALGLVFFFSSASAKCIGQVRAWAIFGNWSGLRGKVWAFVVLFFSVGMNVMMEIGRGRCTVKGYGLLEGAGARELRAGWIFFL